MKRVRIQIAGIIQGVGFRPFVAVLAARHQIGGFIRKDGASVVVEAQANEGALEAFVDSLRLGVPGGAIVREMRVEDILACETLAGASAFEIQMSYGSSQSAGGIPFDRGPCDACALEIQNPSDRRYLYPFTSCTACGPRYTVIEALPFDRQRTTMSDFKMCSACQLEYSSLGNRRYHSQLNCCPSCGPTAAFHSLTPKSGPPLKVAAQTLLDGGVIALKGVGGYQMVCLATDEAAIARLRKIKARPHKPLAVLYKSIEQMTVDCEITVDEQAWIVCAAAPIVLVRKRIGCRLGEWIAPGLNSVGVLLPASPLHAILAELVDQPLVLTSGNLAGESMIIDDDEAMKKLAPAVDGILTHNRKILRPADDPVMQIVNGRPMTLRLGRGNAPQEINLDCPPGVLAVGGHLNNTVAVSLSESLAVLSPHIGTLTSVKTRERFASTISDLKGICGQPVHSIVHDQHPDYGSTLWAEAQDEVRRVAVPHHVAHVAATWSEHQLTGRALALAWDGWGLGEDGTMWGGECFEMSADGLQRVAHLRPFPVPGGVSASHDPRRSAIGLLHSCGLLAQAKDWTARASRDGDLEIFTSMVERETHAPLTSSIGRLFDAVSALLGLCEQVSYEGQAAMAVEAAAAEEISHTPWFRYIGEVFDPTDLLAWMLSGGQKIRVGEKALALHQWLVQSAVELCIARGMLQIVVGGGVFQNRLLTEMLIAEAARHHVKVYVPERVPPNDGGLAYGQLAAFGRWNRVSRNPG